jgi:hypothetical protein
LRLQSPTTEAYLTCNQDSSVQIYYNNTEKFRTSSAGIDVLGDGTFEGNISLTGGGIIEAPSVTGGEDLTLKAAGKIDIIIDSNGNSGDSETFKILKHTNEVLLTVSETGDATFTGNINLNDTNTKLLEGSGNALRIQTNSGYVDVGPMNSGYCHLQTDRNQFYFNKQVVVDGHCVPYTSLSKNLGSTTNLWNTTYSRYFESNSTQSRTKIRVWSGSTYGFGMQTGYTFGGLDNNYAITCQMSNTNGRGFWWGDTGHTNAQGAFACTTQGKFTIAHSLRLGYGESDTTLPGSTYTFDVSGTMRATSDVIAFSDKRVKENIVTVENALDKVTKLRGVTYTRKDIGDKTTKLGVIAQEVLEVLPEVVSIDDEDKHSVAYGNMAGVFIEAIKELKAEVDSLKKEIKQLKK